MIVYYIIASELKRFFKIFALDLKLIKLTTPHDNL